MIDTVGGNVRTVIHVKINTVTRLYYSAAASSNVVTNTAICSTSSNMMSVAWWMIHSVFLLRLPGAATTRSVARTFPSQRNALALDEPAPPGASSFSPALHLPLAEVGQQRVQVPPVGGGVQRALPHHAQSHAQSGPDVVRHHGGRRAAGAPRRSGSVLGGLALER